ncbi:MAG TPA: NAD(P)/FAD-dependent oxidoreductase [Ktedonobacterales bacterium]|nr:NAD(P)/FAD-dependent oxidoreductase [Ktedonobacterales bacterium]
MSSTVSRGAEDFDVIVVGASFAGLAFAGAAAARGLRVLVLERDAEIGGVVRTTGVLFSDVLDIMDVPARFLMNAVRRVSIQPPGTPPIEIRANAYRFYMADVTGMLRWMADSARAHGATIRTGSPFVSAERDADGAMRVAYGGPSEAEGNGATTRAPHGVARGAFLIGADGTRSRVAESMGLDTNTKLLAGAEWLVEGVPIERDLFSLVMDHDLAPGYCVWLAPHGDIAAFGVAGHLHDFKPAESLKRAQAAFQKSIDLSKMRVVQRKAGVIPVGGQLRRVYRDDARGRALLLGDAAGLCGAATGGGIYPALISGRIAAHAVANEVLNGTRGAVKSYQRDLLQSGRLGAYLKVEDWIRFVLDRMDSNADLAALYALFGSPEGHRVLQSTLLETPIISMDGSFLGILRSLMSRHPRIYGSAARMVWRRATARA